MWTWPFHFQISNSSSSSFPTLASSVLPHSLPLAFARSRNVPKTRIYASLASQHDTPLLPSPAPPRFRNRRENTTKQRLEELAQYVQTNGNADVPYTFPSGLGRWAAEQRHRWRRGLLPTDIYRALAALGFSFDAYDAKWNARFRQLADFHSKHGHCLVSHDDHDVPPGLYAWTLVQRQRFKQGRLDDARSRRLDGLGFAWEIKSSRVEDRFKDLEAFVACHGHARVPRVYPENPSLAFWVESIRTKWRKGDLDGLTAAQQAKLRALGVDKDTPSSSLRWGWEARVAQLEGVRARQGHLNGRLPNKGQFTGLRDWATRQRALWRVGRVPRERVQQLQDLGFAWDPESARIRRKIAEIDDLIASKGFSAAYAHLVLLGSDSLLGAGTSKTSSWQLGKWVQTVRKAAGKGALPAPKAEALLERGLLPEYTGSRPSLPPSRNRQ